LEENNLGDVQLVGRKWLINFVGDHNIIFFNSLFCG